LGLYFGYSLPYERKKVNSYVSILEVAPGSPADKAGLKPNDYIIGLTGARRKYITLGDVTRLLYEMRVGDKIEFIVLRNLRDKITKVVVVENIEFDGFY
jgi:serine protease Do